MSSIVEPRTSTTTAVREDAVLASDNPVKHDHDADTDPSSEEEVFEYPSFKRVVLIMVALYLSMFLVALDRTIIGTAIPKITDAFHSLNDVGWYASAYLITSSAFQLFFGRIYTFYTVKWVLLGAICLFEIGV
jgi:hypothetical protein